MNNTRFTSTVEMLAITTALATYTQTILALLFPHVAWMETLWAILYILAGIGAIVLSQPEVKKDINIFDLSGTPFHA